MSKIGKPRTSKGLATLLAKLADGKIARDILILDLSNVDSAPAEFFVICTSDSFIQSEAISYEIVQTTKDMDLQAPRTEGLEAKEWILIDYFDVVVHIMLQSTREFYKLEKLWGDAAFHKLTDSGRLGTFKNEELLKIYNL